jgi:succinylglutamate desuccinylase
MLKSQNKNLDYYNYFQSNQEKNGLEFVLNLRSKNHGKNVLFIAGIHGNESAPVAAMLRLHKTLSLDTSILKTGEISFLLGNPMAFLENRRCLKHNINRSIDGGVNPNDPELQRQLEIKKYFKENNFDLIIDFHTILNGEFRLVVFEKNQSLGLPFLVQTCNIGYFANFQNQFKTGSLLSEFIGKKNTSAFGMECGNNKSIKSISIAFDQMVGSLEYLGLIEKNTIPKMKQLDNSESIQIFDIRENISIKPGFNYIDENVKTGTFLKKGQIYATYDGGYNIAHEDMNLLLPVNKPSLNSNYAGYLAKMYRFKR